MRLAACACARARARASLPARLPGASRARAARGHPRAARGAAPAGLRALSSGAGDGAGVAAGDALDGVGLVVAPGGGGDPRVLDALAAGAQTLAEVGAAFPFELDRFQRQAVGALLEGHSVVVCAPTGAGKTAVAEAAAIACLARGQRAIYTTPLKALSNQKLLEMRERFGADRLGLQTGDVSLNSEADITIMTTEILRNIMYRLGSPPPGEGAGAGGPAPPPREGRLDDVGLIVLDEVHYLGDPYRGTVWEEVIINCPKHVRILAMSATVKNPDDLGAWVDAVHGSCKTVRTGRRPVPLLWQYSRREGRRTRVMPLLSASGKQLSRELRPRSERLREMVEEAGGEWGRWRGAADGGGDDDWSIFAADDAPGDGDYRGWRGVPQMEDVVAELRQRALLPAIWFVFSRKGCDASAARVRAALGPLVTPEERAEIEAEVARVRAAQPECLRQDGNGPELLLAGIASHHAGCLPGWKSLVERLFQRGLLKIVFATDTLAAGINMPARTTVIDTLSRRRGGSRFVRLTHNELLQMAGRAGRRGYDTVGHCLVVQGRFEGAQEAFETIAAGPEPILSQFSAGYGMVLNVLASKSLGEARAFLGRSFGAFQAGQGLEAKRREIAEIEAEAQDTLARLRRKYKRALGPEAGGGGGGGGDGGRAPFEIRRLASKLEDEERTLRHLEAQLSEVRGDEALERLTGAGLPRAVALELPGPQGPKAAMALAVVEVDEVGGAAVAGEEEEEEEGSAAGEAGDDDDDDDDDYDEAEEEADGAGLLGDDEDEADSFVRWEQRVLCVLQSGAFVAVAPDAIVGVLEEGAEAADLHAAVEAQARALGPADWRPWSASVSGPGWKATGRGRGAPAAGRAGRPAAEREEPLHCGATTADSRDLGARVPPVEFMARVAYVEGGVDVVADLEMSVRFQRGIADAVREQLEAAELGGGGPGGGGPREPLPKKAAKKLSRANRLLRRADRLRSEMEEIRGREWRTFEDALRVLAAAGAVSEEGDRIVARPLGDVAREVRCENELWMATVLASATVASLPPPRLAAVVGAVVTGDVIGTKPGVAAAYGASAPVLDALDALEGPRARLEEVQLEHLGPAAWGAALDDRLCGLVEAWAGGATWEQLASDTTLDDGDLARLLSRVVDVLRQVRSCRHLPPALRDNATAAMTAMVRQPISDLL